MLTAVYLTRIAKTKRKGRLITRRGTHTTAVMIATNEMKPKTRAIALRLKKSCFLL